MRITKELASNVAKKMTSEKSKALEESKKQFDLESKKLYLSTVPNEVVNFWEKFPQFVESNDYVRDMETGLYVEFGERLPISKREFRLTKDLAKRLHSYHDTRKELQKLTSQIERAIYELRTLKRVQEQFPEAVEFIQTDTPVKMEISINLSNIRKQLK